jgi:hypothetical protein
MLVLIGTYLVIYITQREIQGKNCLFACTFCIIGAGNRELQFIMHTAVYILFQKTAIKEGTEILWI